MARDRFERYGAQVIDSRTSEDVPFTRWRGEDCNRFLNGLWEQAQAEERAKHRGMPFAPVDVRLLPTDSNGNIRQMTARWDDYFMDLALRSARMSKDPNRMVGAVLVTDRRAIITTGFNGFPRGIEDDHRLDSKVEKLPRIVHAEMNCICECAYEGRSTLGSTLYIACIDERGAWSGPPCTPCAIHIIQAGIREVVHLPWPGQSSWMDDLKRAHALLLEANVAIREVPVPLVQVSHISVGVTLTKAALECTCPAGRRNSLFGPDHDKSCPNYTLF